MRGDDDWDFFHRKWDKNAPSFRFSVKPQTPSKDVCEGLVVANRKRAYPLLYNQMNRFKEDWKSKDCENIANINDQALGLHFWNKVIKFKGGEGISINSLLIKVMQKNCPVISHTQLIPLLNL